MSCDAAFIPFYTELLKMRLLSSFLVVLIKGYQVVLSPLFGNRCRFHPTCSEYAMQAFQKFPIYQALWYSIKRILKCHPFHPGGSDPSPKKELRP